MPKNESQHKVDFETADRSLAPRRYRRFLRTIMVSTAAVALTPLIIMTAVNYFQYRRALKNEAIRPINRITSNTKRSLELFLSERQSALRIVASRPFRELCDPTTLMHTLRVLRKSLTIGSVVDLGIVDSQGIQRCYVGPFKLQGKSYRDQDWFHQVKRHGVHISDIFLGYRKRPHFVIAILHEEVGGGEYILRATIDSEKLSEQILTVGLRPESDAFLINRRGVLQSPPRRYGKVLQKCPLRVPHFTSSVEVLNTEDERGQPIFLGYAYVQNSPFILLMVKRHADVMGEWFTLRAELFIFLAVSSILILLVIVLGARKLVRNLQQTDLMRTNMLHKMEHTSKLASIGRLAAGVAHEINNPLAIINEKAGLLKDLVELGEDFPRKKKTLGLVSSILKSVDRCSTITHRLLGFAKHMDVSRESIDLPHLLREVMGFLDKEAEYRDIDVQFEMSDDFPTIYSDRGQLQQVFLNITNNAFAAVGRGGRVAISLTRQGDDRVSVTVADNGVGISKENLERIFEPFFSTKAGAGQGTGLGLSISYGIVEKLGGRIQVESEQGRGTRFSVILPIGREE